MKTKLKNFSAPELSGLTQHNIRDADCTKSARSARRHTYIGSRWSRQVALVRQLINESTARLAYHDRGRAQPLRHWLYSSLISSASEELLIKSVHDECRLYTAEGAVLMPVSYGRLASVMTWKRTMDIPRRHRSPYLHCLYVQIVHVALRLVVTYYYANAPSSARHGYFCSSTHRPNSKFKPSMTQP